jgi:hypothetical protein
MRRTIEVWESPDCATEYSVSLCEDGEEIRCLGGEEDMRLAVDLAKERAEQLGVSIVRVITRQGTVLREIEVP